MTTNIQTPIKVSGGLYDGHMIRRARKAGKCHCGTVIDAGDLYLEGEGNNIAGGFGNERLCLNCGGPEAVLAGEGTDDEIRKSYDRLASELRMMPLGDRGYGLMTDLVDLEDSARKTLATIQHLAKLKREQPEKAEE